MKSISCSEISGQDCNYQAVGETAEEVKQKLLDHGRDAHAEMMEGMSEEEMNSMMQEMDNKIKQKFSEE